MTKRFSLEVQWSLLSFTWIIIGRVKLIWIATTPPIRESIDLIIGNTIEMKQVTAIVRIVKTQFCLSVKVS